MSAFVRPNGQCRKLRLAVFALADRITVLVYGRVIASGDPARIRANPEVQRA